MIMYMAVCFLKKPKVLSVTWSSEIESARGMDKSWCLTQRPGALSDQCENNPPWSPFLTPYCLCFLSSLFAVSCKCPQGLQKNVQGNLVKK